MKINKKYTLSQVCNIQIYNINVNKYFLKVIGKKTTATSYILVYVNNLIFGNFNK